MMILMINSTQMFVWMESFSDWTSQVWIWVSRDLTDVLLCEILGKYVGY